MAYTHTGKVQTPPKKSKTPTKLTGITANTPVKSKMSKEKKK